jgi:hypothetical protein
MDNLNNENNSLHNKIKYLSMEDDEFNILFKEFQKEHYKIMNESIEIRSNLYMNDKEINENLKNFFDKYKDFFNDYMDAFFINEFKNMKDNYPMYMIKKFLDTLEDNPKFDYFDYFIHKQKLFTHIKYNIDFYKYFLYNNENM